MTTTTPRQQPWTDQMLRDLPARTIAVTTRTQSQFSRLQVRFPDGVSRARYDADLTWELLGRTCELPGTKPDLLVVLAEYRRALHDLATSLSTPSSLDGELIP
jgi:hypothetical protein